MNVKLTPGNTDDRTVVEKLCSHLKSWLFGDKEYLNGKLTKVLQDKGGELITRPKKNMKQHLMTQAQKRWLDKPGIVESTIDQLKALLPIQHTRHRSSNNFLINLFADSVAYIFKSKKPSVSFPTHISFAPLLTSN